MGVNLVVAVTDGDWFDTLRHRPDLAEVNFWAPSAAMAWAMPSTPFSGVRISWLIIAKKVPLARFAASAC